MEWKEKVPQNEIEIEVTGKTVDFADRFGQYLTTKETVVDSKGFRKDVNPLTTNQLRKFFGEVKRQQMVGFNQGQFLLLKPKLAYAVGRDDKNTKIKDFYMVISDAIDRVHNPEQFNRFIMIFEAIVAYHKAYEPKKK